MTDGTRYSSWLDNAMSAAKRFKEPDGASEFGGAPGCDPHAHADPPPSHRGYPGRYKPISPPQSVSEIGIESVPRGTGGIP